jgi:hypothetical protein
MPDATYRRRRAATSLIRAALVTVVLLVVYYQARPSIGPSTSASHCGWWVVWSSSARA